MRQVVALPCTAAVGVLPGLAVTWLGDAEPPVATEGTAKVANIAAASILARTVAWADCWGPSAWYFRGVAWGPFSPVAFNAWTLTAWTLNIGLQDDGATPRSALWAGTAPPESAFGAATVLANDASPQALVTRTRLPRSWWLNTPQVQNAPRQYVVVLELASLGTGPGAPTSLVFPA